MKLKLQRASEFRSAPDTAQQFEVAVIYTQMAQTLAALRTAAQLAQGLKAVLHLIVPEVVPYPLPLHKPPVSPAARARRFQVLLSGVAVDTRVDVRLCRDREDGLSDALQPNSIVVMGLKKRCWRTAEQRLAARLRKRGHYVVEVDCRNKSR